MPALEPNPPPTPLDYDSGAALSARPLSPFDALRPFAMGSAIGAVCCLLAPNALSGEIPDPPILAAFAAVVTAGVSAAMAYGGLWVGICLRRWISKYSLLPWKLVAFTSGICVALL